jgi:hypothetical protein
MNQQLPTSFTTMQIEREILDRELSRKWTTATAVSEIDESRSLKTLFSVVATALLGMVGTIASLVR